MLNTPETNTDNVGEPAGLLQRMLTLAAIGMAVSIVIQLGLLLFWIGSPQAEAREWLGLLGASIFFLAVTFHARRLVLQKRMARAVGVLFIAICISAVLVAVALPEALGLALVAPVFGLILSLPYVSRAMFMRMSMLSIALALVLIPVSAFLGANRPSPTPLDTMAQSLPLLISTLVVVILIKEMHAWLAGTMRALREAQMNLEEKVQGRTSDLQTANESIRLEISERRQVESRLLRQTAYLEALHETALAVMNRLDFDQLLDASITHACTLLGVEHGVIALQHPGLDVLTTDFTRGYFRQQELELGHKVTVRRGEGAVGHAWQTGQPMKIADYARWSDRLNTVRPDAFKSAMIAPLKLGDKLLGLLAVANDFDQPEFTDDDLDLLCRYAQIVSIAIDNAQLFEATRANEQVLEQRVADRTEELTTLFGVAQNLSATLDMPTLLKVLFDQIRRLIDFDAGTIFELQDEQMHILHYAGPELATYTPGSRWPLSGHHQELVRTGQPIIIDDVSSDEPMPALFRNTSQADWRGEVPAHIVSWIGVPMKVKDRMIGILTLDSAMPGHFKPRHAELLMAVAQQAALALENARLYAEASKSAAQAERSRLARDLHDSVSQAIYGIVLASRTLEKLADPANARMEAPLQHILSLSEAAMAEIRALIFELRPESLEREGILAALNKQADAIRARYGLSVELALCPSEPAIPLQVKEAVYRIAQEAMHNAVKHAHARHLWLSLSCDGSTGMLEVRDDGVGFDVHKESPGQMGMGTMRERAVSMGGRLEVASERNRGTVIRAIIPTLVPVFASVPPQSSNDRQTA